MSRKNSKIVNHDELSEIKDLTYICTKCYEENYIGRSHIDVQLDMSLVSYNDIDKSQSLKLENSMKDHMLKAAPGYDYNIKLFCSHCNKDTVHVSIDYRLGQIISVLNKAGIYTNFCCEGHLERNDISAPYISFISYDDLLKFDTENELLYLWYKEIDSVNSRYILRVNFSKLTVDDFINLRHIEDLNHYINKYIIKEKLENEEKYY